MRMHQGLIIKNFVIELYDLQEPKRTGYKYKYLLGGIVSTQKNSLSPQYHIVVITRNTRLVNIMPVNSIDQDKT